jgi:uncharacterized membrane protein
MGGKMSDERPVTDSGRIQGFSDGCFAIIITLLVIDIRRPHAAEGQLGHALLEAWPTYAAYALAFTYVGVIWLNHHGLFRHIQRIDTRLNWINLGIIGTSALIPFPTAVLAEAFQAADLADQRAAVALYGTVAGFMSLAWAPIFPYLERHHQTLAPGVGPGYFAAQRSRPWIGVITYGVAIVSGWWFSPWLAIFIFFLMVIYHAYTSEGVSRGDRSQTE